MPDFGFENTAALTRIVCVPACYIMDFDKKSQLTKNM